ncbi:DNA-3-methyladenine glycosylase I [Lutibaculum baratangense]|uniref:DNA-3-methyladenine glycosylase n=1 Tax=Lutibaculum baratangense AMV1 TaxID=631454 RepID=V4RWG6_9HYPH|nr:DNA-3-methyladenine glycosylase I [Lutibaculum baratangense]ESR27355.1 DNA-3-methyladenine glycosylase [Lutibaculum baratangense AMV1]
MAGPSEAGLEATCPWHGGDPLYRAYHDEEWGRPVKDDRRLFEKLCLEGFQAGLSWLTILRKRENFRRAFEGFDIERVASFGEAEVRRLLADQGIVRHEGKIRSTINNAQRTLSLVAEEGSLAGFVWAHEPAPATRPTHVTRQTLAEMTTSPESVALSKALKKRGFTFVGPTTVYAFMQSMGLVNDHLSNCPIRAIVEERRANFVRPDQASTG